MSKIRSRLKRHSKGKSWAKGHSATSNPENMKHRLKAKSRFFQPNLNSAPKSEIGKPASNLTLEALSKHDARQIFASGNKEQPTTINDIAGSFISFNIDDEMLSDSQVSTFKTYKTFASQYSSCSNTSFSKLLNTFRQDSEQHKEMLAVLTALTEIIKERGGNETSTEYFALLMETIEAGKEESEIIAGVSLLAMGIKTVPIPVLRKKFSEAAKLFMNLFEMFIENHENHIIMRSLIGCMSVLLRAQDYVTWTYSETTKYFDALLSFTVHTKPKLRKAAQHAVIAIIHGSNFMLPKTEPSSDGKESEEHVKETAIAKYHPAGNRIAKFCLNQLKPEVSSNAKALLLHTLVLLRETMPAFKTEDIKTVCESILSIMTATNILVRTSCFQTFHSLFAATYRNLSGNLCGKLISALYEYRPDRGDVRQMLVWTTVLKQAHIYLASVDVTLCCNSLPKFIEILTGELWMSPRPEIVANASNALKEILYDCVRPAAETNELAEVHRLPLTKVISFICESLSAPFGEVTKYVVLTFSIVFECFGKHLSEILQAPLRTLGSRYDPQNSQAAHIEHAIIAAIKYLGPDQVLNAIPLTNSNGDVSLDKSWLLPLLREGITGSSFAYFKNSILNLALECNEKWHHNADKNQTVLAHTYELLCCQLWGLFPGFCRNPSDPKNFRLIARTIADALDNNPEYHAPILDGFKELLKNSSDECKTEFQKYSKNFLPRLFNIYTTRPKTTYAAEIRKNALEVIEEYLKVVPTEILIEFFDNAKAQLKTLATGSFSSESVFDIIVMLLVYQNQKNLKKFYDKFIVNRLKCEKSSVVSKDEYRQLRQQRKAYEFLNTVLTSDKEECRKFVRNMCRDIQEILLDAPNINCSVSQASRLRCLKLLIETKTRISTRDELVIKTIPEAIQNYKEFSTKKEKIAEEIILLIGEIYEKEKKINDFVDIFMDGLRGDDLKLVPNTILALRSIVQNLNGNLTVPNLEVILETCLVYLVQKNRPESEASLLFLITFVKSLPSALVANYLETIIKSLSAMVPDTKRYLRIQVGYILRKLAKRFGAENLSKFVPGNDEVTHKRLKKIRKELNREIRKKTEHSGEKASDDESEDEFIPGLEKKSLTIDDILADSSDDESDVENDNEQPGPSNRTVTAQKKKKKKNETYIQESPGEVLDLFDLKSTGKILTSFPMDGTSSDGVKKPKDPNRGFKTAPDGRIIIADGPENDESDDSDGSQDPGDEILEKKTTKRGLDEDSSGDEEMPTASNKKRKAADSVSMRTGKSGEASTKYTAGGKGIHRSLATSVKSGYSGKSGKTDNTSGTKKLAGTEYSSRKAKGDIQKKGKLDPYAYIPLSRNVLNKRKRAKNAGQFRSIVKGARKGAAKGLKKKMKR